MQLALVLCWSSAMEVWTSDNHPTVCSLHSCALTGTKLTKCELAEEHTQEEAHIYATRRTDRFVRYIEACCAVTAPCLGRRC